MIDSSSCSWSEITGSPPAWIEAMSGATASLSSISPVGLTRKPGRSLAIAVWKRVSRSAVMATATMIITAPIAICTFPRIGARRSAKRRPPIRSR